MYMSQVQIRTALLNHLDLDSDADGCSDSNEYYNNTSAAIGQQFGQTGGTAAPTSKWNSNSCFLERIQM
jgi:hypothetical protein